MFAQIRNIGLIKGKIQSQYDEPVLVWKPNFETDARAGKAKRVGGFVFR
jgi:hypothetical protein